MLAMELWTAQELRVQSGLSPTSTNLDAIDSRWPVMCLDAGFGVDVDAYFDASREKLRI